jgi:hypothetical protein
MAAVPITFIGDVHGWSDRLERVVAQAQGEIVLMGDLIDRGPDTPGVLAQARALCDTGRGRCLLGNHEYALIRALGYEPLGVAEEPAFFGAWRDGFGGIAVLEAYGVEDAAGLRAAMGTTLDWLARLPWVLQGEERGQRWIAVHGGLEEERPCADQLAELTAGWAGPEANAEALFSKARMLTLPADMPEQTCVVSGHVPLPKVHVCPTRILCDTSGGQRHRQLSGVIWSEGTVITSGDGV